MTSDDLVKRLREDQPVTQDMVSTMQCALQDAAAERIEELQAQRNFAQRQVVAAEAKLSKSEALLARAVEIIEVVETFADRALWKVIKDKVSELKGETDE